MSEGRKIARSLFYASQPGQALPWLPARRAGMVAGVLTGILAAMASGGLPGSLHAEGVTAIAPPAIYPASTWQGRGSAVLRIMRRLDSHVEQVPLHVGEEVQYGPLSLRLERCLQKPEGLPAESTALLHIDEKQDDGSPAFEGWMFTNDPALGVYAGALYDVQVISCEGEAVAPMAGARPRPATPQLPAVMASHVEADVGHSSGQAASSVQGGGQNGGGQGGDAPAVKGQAGSAEGPLSLLPPAAQAPAQPIPAPQAGETGPH